jgi:hypothetical protein
MTSHVLSEQSSHVLVCAHGSRDVRCANCGPSLLSWTRDWIDSKHEISIHNSRSNNNVHDTPSTPSKRSPSPSPSVSENVKHYVWPVSHIGGHEFAGNIIVYPSGDWYGYVKEQNHLHQILEHHQYDSLPRVYNTPLTEKATTLISMGIHHLPLPLIAHHWASSDNKLTPLWRGRMSISRPNQIDIERTLQSGIQPI